MSELYSKTSTVLANSSERRPETNTMVLTPIFLGILFSLSLNLWLCEAASVIILDQEEVPYVKTSDTKAKLEDAILQGRVKQVARSCKELHEKYQVYDDGLYYLNSSRGVLYQTFCDMTTAGGGWTLVASVHENNMYGKCTLGDRWSNQQGSDPNRPDGEGTWANTVTFGTAESSTSDDYKNPGYYDIAAQDVSVWHVPNNIDLEQWSASSILRYHTENHFLNLYGGNLFYLFKKFPVRFGLGTCLTDNGPAIPIVYDTGNVDYNKNLYGPNSRQSLILKGQPWLFVQVSNQPPVTLNISVLVEVDTFLRPSLDSVGTLRALTGMAMVLLWDGVLPKR
uniref:Fibrinogen C-terminal domain-containing protein n=1 Tax=Cyprinus carpio carpio TaxID=630221 RepID=A0A8C1A1G4_CYPCA